MSLCTRRKVSLVRKLLISSVSVLALIGLGACSAQEGAPTTPAASAPTKAAGGDVDTFLAAHNLTGKSVTEIVDLLDATNDDRQAGPYGSVRPSELILADDANEVTLPIEDSFYLSIAPYVTQTHECYNHNLASCQGELADQEIDVKIVDSEGKELFAGRQQTGPNGFAGFWLPRDIKATVTITADGKTATSEVGTGADDPTCLTTMQLS